jgi:hypothetical protein
MARGSKFAVEVSERAMEMLVFHARFLAQISEKAAARLIWEFVEKAKSLETMPARCP